MKRNLLILIMLIVLSMCTTACGSGENTSNKNNWNEGSIANVLPYPETDKIEITIDDKASFFATIEDFSEEAYRAYAEKCKQHGFDVDAKSDNTNFNAYNDEGYKLSMLYLGENGLSITLEAPKGFNEFKWPSSKIAKLLPIPKSKLGKIEWERASGFVIYIAETSLDDYNAYVDECIKKGFTVKYQKGDDYYYAYDEAGYYLSLKYEGNNTMFLQIEKTDNSSSDAVDKDSKVKDDSKETKKGVSKDFKKTMDAYEKFAEEYVRFMEKYNNANSDDVLSMAGDYADYMKKYTEMMKAISEIDEDELSTADALYYAEVNARITKKLSGVVQ